MRQAPVHLVAGPADHGVVRFGLDLHRQLRHNGFGVSLCRRAAADAMVSRRGGLHIQFTDRLFGATAEAASGTVGTIAAAVRAAGGRLTATLHDLPQLSDGDNFRRRTAAYLRVAGSCDAVVVSSEHERLLLQDNGINAPNVTVIPLPIDRYVGTCAPAPSPGRLSLGVFGFLYPGKGHDDVIAAAADLPSDVEVVAIGSPSAGHEDLVTDLSAGAARQGRRFRVTGHVDDRDLPGVLRQITVPIAAHRHISASGSLNTWLAAGRRPLAPVNRYTSEIERRNPGTLALYEDTTDGLRYALRAAIRQPETTWLPADIAVTPSPRDAAAAYTDFFHRWLS